VALTDLEVIERIPLASVGVSGARIERLITGDGRVLIAKVIEQRSDWLIQATGDDGRLARLWTSGVLQQLPPGVDSAIESVEEIPGGWVVVMRDVTDSLLPAGQALTRRQSRRILAATASLHDAFAGVRIDAMCPLVDRLAVLTPAVARNTLGIPFRARVLEGWDRFAELASADVGPAMGDLLERPGKLAAALADFPKTLLHGDLKVANIGLDGSTVVFLDWGTLTGTGPRAVDYAWYLGVNGAAIDASLDDQLADVAAVLTPDDHAALPLAMLGALLQLGWDKAMGATSSDPIRRARERAGLTWWCRRAAEALDLWSPA
jgi:hypothetical protein